MSTDQPISIPDFESLAQSVKAIKRSVPATSDGVYGYFADQLRLASTVADTLDARITNALTALPASLGTLDSVGTILAQIAKIDAAQRAGEIPAEKAGAALKQLQGKLAEPVSSNIKSFGNAASDLSESAGRLSNYAKTSEVRLKDAKNTEISNLAREKKDDERETARLETLEARLQKLNDAVDKKRGGPTDELLSLIPDEQELSSLVDVGAADAAAPEAAAAKKAVELAVKQIKKILEMVGKLIELEQLIEIRDRLSDAATAQRTVQQATQERLQKTNTTLGVLDTVGGAGASMTTLAAETNKLVTAFSGFAKSLQDLDGQPVTADGLAQRVGQMKTYLSQARDAHNNVILT